MRSHPSTVGYSSLLQGQLSLQNLMNISKILKPKRHKKHIKIHLTNKKSIERSKLRCMYIITQTQRDNKNSGRDIRERIISNMYFYFCLLWDWIPRLKLKIQNSNNKNTQKPLYLTDQKIENQNFCFFIEQCFDRLPLPERDWLRWEWRPRRRICV